jgi:hypothetical protein
MEKAKKVARPEEILNFLLDAPMMNEKTDEQTQDKGKRKQPATPTEARPKKQRGKEPETKGKPMTTKTTRAMNTAALPPEMPNQEPLPDQVAKDQVAKEWEKWIFNDFDHRSMVSDDQNAEKMLTYLLNERPDICCKKIAKGGKKEVLCKCLMRIRKALQTAGTPQREEWKILFAKISSALGPIARASGAVTSMIKFLHEFQHTCTLTSNRNVKSYVLKTPIGNLLMDFNGLAELGGYQQRSAYHDFYTKFLTGVLSQHKEASGYVQRVYKCRERLNLFLDMVEYCSQQQEHPSIKSHKLCLNICDYRSSNGYYLNDTENYDFSPKKNAKKELQMTTDTNNIIPPGKELQRTTDTNKNFPPARDFIKDMEDDFIIGHPNIPLFTPHSDGCPTDPNQPYIILRTNGLLNTDRIITAGHVGIMQGDLDNLAGMLVKPLLQLVGWDGQNEQGTRDISFLVYGRDDIQAQLHVLKENMVLACRKLLPSLLPDVKIDFKIHCEAFLCPAPLLNESYEWQIPKPQVATREHLKKLSSHGIFSFWGFFPLTKDGMFVAIYPANGTKDGTKEKVIFVPHQKVLLSPMQIPFVQKLRTSIIGSPGCKFSIYIYPETLDKSIVEKVIGGKVTSPPVHPFKLPRGSASSGKEVLKKLGDWVGF